MAPALGSDPARRVTRPARTAAPDLPEPEPPDMAMRKGELVMRRDVTPSVRAENPLMRPG